MLASELYFWIHAHVMLLSKCLGDGNGFENADKDSDAGSLEELHRLLNTTPPGNSEGR